MFLAASWMPLCWLLLLAIFDDTRVRDDAAWPLVVSLCLWLARPQTAWNAFRSKSGGRLSTSAFLFLWKTPQQRQLRLSFFTSGMTSCCSELKQDRPTASFSHLHVNGIDQEKKRTLLQQLKIRIVSLALGTLFITWMQDQLLQNTSCVNRILSNVSSHRRHS